MKASPLTNLRKSIFYLQQALREEEYKEDKELLSALDTLANKWMEQKK